MAGGILIGTLCRAGNLVSGNRLGPL